MQVPKLVTRAFLLGFGFLVVQILISSLPFWAGSTNAISQKELAAVLREHDLKIRSLENQLKSAESSRQAIPNQKPKSVGSTINIAGRQLEGEEEVIPDAVFGWKDNKALLICLGSSFLLVAFVHKIAYDQFIKLVLKPPHAELTTTWRTIDTLLDTTSSALCTFFLLVWLGPLGATVISFFYSLVFKAVYLYGVRRLELFLNEGLPSEEDSQHYRNKYGVVGVNGSVERWQRDLARDMVGKCQITTDTKFQEMDRSMLQVMLLFSVQVTLTAFLLIALVKEEPPLNWNNVSQLSFYFCSLPVVLVARYSDLQRRFEDEVPVWGLLIFSSQEDNQATNENTGTTFELFPDLVYVRMMMSWFVNSVVHETVMRCTPLLLMKSGGYLDFVKDTFAIIFIVCLDDSDSTPYQISELAEELEWTDEPFGVRTVSAQAS